MDYFRKNCIRNTSWKGLLGDYSVTKVLDATGDIYCHLLMNSGLSKMVKEKT